MASRAPNQSDLARSLTFGQLVEFGLVENGASLQGDELQYLNEQKTKRGAQNGEIVLSTLVLARESPPDIVYEDIQPEARAIKVLHVACKHGYISTKFSISQLMGIFLILRSIL